MSAAIDYMEPRMGGLKDLLRTARGGRKQREVAEAIDAELKAQGVSPPHDNCEQQQVSDWEREVLGVPDEKVPAVAKVLGLSEEDVLLASHEVRQRNQRAAKRRSGRSSPVQRGPYAYTKAQHVEWVASMNGDPSLTREVRAALTQFPKHIHAKDSCEAFITKHDIKGLPDVEDVDRAWDGIVNSGWVDVQDKLQRVFWLRFPDEQ